MYKKLFLTFAIVLNLYSSEKSENNLNVHSAKVNFAMNDLKAAMLKLPKEPHISFEFVIDSLILKEAYKISLISKNTIQIKGGDESGLMYGGLALAERIRINKSITKRNNCY